MYHFFCPAWFEPEIKPHRRKTRKTARHSLDSDLVLHPGGFQFLLIQFLLKEIKATREGFLRKNIVAVSFFQNCAIHQYS